jgi:hypothetical protein
MVRNATETDKLIRQIVMAVSKMTLDGRDRLMAEFADCPEWFPAWNIESRHNTDDEDDSELIIDSRFGDIGEPLLRILQDDDDYCTAEFTLLQKLWPRDARHLTPETVKKNRPLRQKLAQRVHQVNRKLLEEGGRWQIVRSKDNDGEVLFYLGQR